MWKNSVSCVWAIVPCFNALTLAVLKSPTSTATGSAVVVSIGNVSGYVGPTLVYWSKSVATLKYQYEAYAIVMCTLMLSFAGGMMMFRSGLGASDKASALKVIDKDSPAIRRLSLRPVGRRLSVLPKLAQMQAAMELADKANLVDASPQGEYAQV